MAEYLSLIVARVYPWLEDWLTLVSLAIVAPPYPLRDIPQESISASSFVSCSVRPLVRSLHALRPLPFNRFSAKLPPRKYAVFHPLSLVFLPATLFASKKEGNVNAKISVFSRIEKEKENVTRFDTPKKEVIRFLLFLLVSTYFPSSQPSPAGKTSSKWKTFLDDRSKSIPCLPREKHAKRTRTCHRKS